MKSTILYFTCIVLVLTSSYQPCFTQLDPVKESLINNLIESLFIPYNNVTGMSLSVVHNGQSVHSKGYGYQNIERGIPATNRTLFSIGSITKSFIGVIVVKVLSEKFPEAGESILDVPVAKLITNYNFTLSDRNRAESTTFRDMLSHRTCLRATDIEIIFGTMKYDSNREYNYRTRYEREACSFRNGFVYNNALYVLSGELIANIAGKSIEELVREFMREIGMVDSNTIDVSGSYEGNPLMSEGYVFRDGQIIRFNQTLLRRNEIGLGAGGILSTSNDMAQYGLFHLNQGKVGDKQVVSKEAMSWLYKSANPIPTFSGQGPYGYSLGLMLSMLEGEQWIGHDGFWPPYFSQISMIPGSNISIFIVINGPGYLAGEVSYQYVFSEILDILRGFSTKNPTTQSELKSVTSTLSGYEFSVQTLKENGLEDVKTILANEIKNKRTKIDFNEVLGVYGEQLAGDLTVKLDPGDNSSLRMEFGEWGKGKLYPTSNPVRYEIIWDTDLLHHFYSYPTPVPSFQIDFSIQDTAVLMTDHVGVVLFKKDYTLDKYPSIPWAPNSCGPAEL